MRDEKNIVIGRQPIQELLKTETTIERIFVQRGLTGGIVNAVINTAKKRGLRPEFVDSKRLDEISGNGNHQGLIAFISEYRYYEVEDMLELARTRNEDPLLVLLDDIEDPQNLGAIIRSAYLLGAHGVIIPKRGAATLTSSAAKAAAGAASHMMVARVTNLKNTIESLKENGLWFVYADAEGESMYKVNLKGPLGIVIGNEGKGVSRIVREYCDFSASIPMYTDTEGVDSFNASVAFGILGAEVLRQRHDLVN